MDEVPKRRVVSSKLFERDIKKLFKRYRHIQEDVQPLINELKDGKTPGDEIPEVGYPLYKVRLANRDAQKGKSGGYRLIYYLRTEILVILITIYSKSERENITPEQLSLIVEEVVEQMGDLNTPPAN